MRVGLCIVVLVSNSRAMRVYQEDKMEEDEPARRP